MRVTSTIMVEKLMANLQQTQQRMSRLQEEMSTGRRVLRPQDDPVATGTIMRLNSGLVDLNRYGRAIEDARGWLSYTDGVLSRAVDQVQDLRQLVVQGASGTLTEQDRTVLAEDARGLQQNLLDLANSVYDGRHIFAGHRTTAPPFEIDGGGNVTFSGDDGQQLRDLGPSVELQVNLPGDAVFGGLLELAGTIIADLEAGDVGALSGQRLADLDGELDNLLLHMGTVGARHNRCALIGERVLDMELSFLSLLSEVEDADLARTITSLRTAETVYETALAATARALQTGLHHYLR